MMNPDRIELGLQPTSVLENPKRSGHIPRWLRVPAFAIRASLAILTATPGMVITADAINRMENSSIVYDSGQNVTVNSQYEFDQPLPSPTETPQPPIVYKLYLTVDDYVYRDFQDPSKFIGKYGRTDIRLKVGQTLEISATGKVNCCAYVNCGSDPYRWAYTCKDAPVFNPDGYHVWRDGTVCPGDAKMLVGDMGTGEPFGGSGTGPKILIGSYWKGSVDRNGFLWLYLDGSDNCWGGNGGFDITVTVTDPLLPTPTNVPLSRPAFTPEPIRTTTPAEKGPDLSGWLLGAGAILLVGLGANELYKRYRAKRGVGATGGAGGGIGSTVPLIEGISGAIGGPSNLNTAPSTGPTQQKNPEWIIGQQDFERRWQAAKSKLSPVRPGDTGNEYDYILDRFKAAMNIVHEMSLDNSAIQVPKMALRIRAGMEYVIPEVWPDNSILRRFFDPRFNAGYFTDQDFAKMVYLPEMYRSLSKFNKVQRGDVRRIHRILVHALHPDTSKNEADPKVQDSVDDLLKRFNPAWPYIENLIKLTP